jgi:predicted nucleic acid-binding protein
MTARRGRFLDSNILVYTDDHRSPEKREIASDLVEACSAEKSAVVSTQVLQEYFSAATKKLRMGPDYAKGKVRLFSEFNLFRIGPEDILAAIDLHRIHQISFWDGLIVRAAIRSGCSVLYSEDLQAGRRIDGLEIVNPFFQH